MTRGYVKFYREWFDHPVINKDNDHWMVWCYLWMNATHAQIPMMFAGEMITLQPRQLITGRYVISERCRVQESKVKRILAEFEKYHLIDRQRSNKNSLITLLVTDAERNSDRQNDQQVIVNRPTGDRQVTTNKNERMGNVKKERLITQAAGNRFVNFKHSGRDWDAEAAEIMEHDMAKAEQERERNVL